KEVPLSSIGPQYLRRGTDLTLVGAGYSAELALQTAERLAKEKIQADVIDLRVLNPWDPTLLIESVGRTGRLIAIDGSWRNCGLGGEIIASVAERLAPSALKAPPMRVTIAEAPAPTSRVLEEIYYPKVDEIVTRARALFH